MSEQDAITKPTPKSLLAAATTLSPGSGIFVNCESYAKMCSYRSSLYNLMKRADVRGIFKVTTKEDGYKVTITRIRGPHEL